MNLECTICKVLVLFPKSRLLLCRVELMHCFQKYHLEVYKNILQQAFFSSQ